MKIIPHLLIVFLLTSCITENTYPVKSIEKESAKTNNEALNAFLKAPIDLMAFKKAKGGANSGGYSGDHFYKPNYIGFFMDYLYFHNTPKSTHIVVYRKGETFGDFFEDRDTLIQLFVDQPDPDLKAANLVGKSIKKIKEKFGDNDFTNGPYVFYTNQDHALLTLYVGKNDKVQWFKWTLLKKNINSIKDIPEIIVQKSNSQL